MAKKASPKKPVKKTTKKPAPKKGKKKEQLQKVKSVNFANETQ